MFVVLRLSASLLLEILLYKYIVGMLVCFNLRYQSNW